MSGAPADWTTEIWSGRHTQPAGQRRQSARRRGAARPAAGAARDRIVGYPPGAGTRNGEPLYDFPAKRIVHHLIAETPVRTSSLRGLGATLNVFAIESFDRRIGRAGGRGPGRLPALGAARSAGSRGRRAGRADEPVAGRHAGRHRAGRGIGFARYKNLAAYAAVVAEVAVDESVRVHRVWCAADAGLVINPDGAINQLEGGIIQAISWALKEGVRLDAAGISSRDWESYPVLNFSEVPEIDRRTGRPMADNPPLGIGEATRRPDRRGDRQRRRAGARHPAPRPADDPRAGHGGAAQDVARPTSTGVSLKHAPSARSAFKSAETSAEIV